MADRGAMLKTLREHIVAESTHDMDAVLDGMTSTCFNDIACIPKPFVGPKAVARRYREHWAGFPDFKVRVRKILAVTDRCIVTENEWSGTHRGPFLGFPPTGRKVRVRTAVVWHFRRGKIQGESVFFDLGTVLKQIGATVTVRPPRAKPSRARGTRSQRVLGRTGS
jgi:steroid delta-isomerase-like uncharacterized protein